MVPESIEMQANELERLAGEGGLIAYFGYGSLVNPKTHRTNVLHFERAQLRGFARRWQARPDPADLPIALLSSAPSTVDDELDGLLVFDRAENLPALDDREAGYDRLDLSPNDLVLRSGGALPNCPLYVYSGRAPFAPDSEHFILQSYLDAVLQGYLHQYGEHGARNFVERTADFDTALITDRNEPHYPRSVELSADEIIHFDALTSFMKRTSATSL